MLLVAILHAAPPATAKAYNGRAGELAVRIPRVNATVAIDGTLNDSVWTSAAVLTGFSQFTPTDGRPAQDSTEVLVWYSPTAIYFGVRAFEAHGAVHATLANRDHIDADDNVELILSTYHDGRQAYVFAVNPLGVQEDGTMTEGRPADPGSSVGIGVSVARPPLDLSPDFVYESKGRLAPYGYEVEIRIPFKSLKYKSQNIQDWGFNVIRKVQHSGYEDTWTPALQSGTSFLAQSGTLVGLTDLSRGLVLDVNPIVTAKANGDGSVPSRWHYDIDRPQLGANVRYGLTQNLTLNGTFRPDFAEVESDVLQFSTDPRVAVFYPEKRPFFLDGIEQFATPATPLIYTRNIVSPLGAAKLTGKIGDFSVAYLGADDDASHSLFDVVRFQRDIGTQAKLGVVATDVEDGGSYNRIAGADAVVPFAKVYTLTLQGDGSMTRAGRRSTAGPDWHAKLDRNGHTFQSRLQIYGDDPQFTTRSGFVAEPNVVTAAWLNTVTWYGKPHVLIEQALVDYYGGAVWDYRQFTSGHQEEILNRDFDTHFTFRGGWNAQFSYYPDVYRYDPSLYRSYYLGHIGAHDTTYTPFVGTHHIENNQYVAQLATPQFAHFSGSVVYNWGRGENFYEWASADIGVLSSEVTWRPTTQLRFDLLYSLLSYHRHIDGTTVATTRVPRLTLEYQLSRPIFIRLVGQYAALYQDTLRDESRTNLPIFIQSTLGVYTRATAFTTNNLATQLLFAYQPVPGTVCFVGYTNAATEPLSFHLDPVRRTADGFFVKFSYLFRSAG